MNYVRLSTPDAVSIADEAALNALRSIARRRRAMGECTSRRKEAARNAEALLRAHETFVRHNIKHREDELSAIVSAELRHADNFRAIEREHRAAIKVALETALSLV